MEQLKAFDILRSHDAVDLSFPLSLFSSRKPKISSVCILHGCIPYYAHVHSRADREALIKVGVQSYKSGSSLSMRYYSGACAGLNQRRS